MSAVLLSIVLLGGQPLPTCPSANASLEQLLTDSRSLQDRDENPTASACFALAADRAAAVGDATMEANARLGLARTSLEISAYARAAQEAQHARDLFDQQQDRLGVARADATLGSAASLSGQRDIATKRYLQAIQVFRELGADADRASALVSYAVAADLPVEQELTLLDEALALARALKLRRIEGRALHVRADQEFSRGLFDTAVRDLSAAIDVFQDENQASNLADAYVSMGRIHRAHGQPEDAIGFYDQAAAIQEQIGDLRGLVQSTNAKAVALSVLKRYADSRVAYERALDLARKTGVPRIVNFQQGNLAAAYGAEGDYAGAIRLLEDVVQRETDPYILAYRYSNLAADYLLVKQPARALDNSDKAVALAEQSNNRELLSVALLTRGRVLQTLNEPARALADAEASTRIIEEMRARLVPLDFMKRGFSDRNQEVYGFTISLLQARRDSSASLVISEQARARAFLDLLASRSLVERRAAVAMALPQGIAREADVALSSFAAAAPASSEEIAGIAARLRSTIVAYWVENDELFVWVVAPGAPVRSARVAASRSDLERVVTASLPTARGTDLASLRQLYDWLIAPVERWLPPPGSTLTVVAHGPLFRLSFAALRDSRGRYLIERFALGYSPSISAFAFTGRLADQARSVPPSYLLVADPSPLPAGLDASPLASLPASLREAQGIRRTLGATFYQLLSGTRASEPLVRAAMPGKRIIHIATHALVNDDEPFDSYLALGMGKEGTGADGRLTVRELYEMDLKADLVILSACRTATGRLSGDGIAGLSRALFYAGAASVIATQWDVADEPSARLMVLFYEKWRGTTDKRRALRAAQLQMIRELRAGSLVVRTPLGTVRLREQPFNWAGYQLFGEP